MAALQETQALLESVAVPVQAPAMEAGPTSAGADTRSEMTDSAETSRMPPPQEGAETLVTQSIGAAVDPDPDPTPYLGDVAPST